MSNILEILDCTLRDGAYINNSNFGVPTIKGIIKKMQDAKLEVIECGWLKDSKHVIGSSYYHIPNDLEQYLISKDAHCTYAVMIDWDRYDIDILPDNDGKSIDAIRVVFPYGKHKQGIKVGKAIRDKGYQVYFQIANTLAYSKDDLKLLIDDMNDFMPTSLSIVDTFGAMYPEDLSKIVSVVGKNLNKKINLGFHAHNNQQLAFSNAMLFIDLLINDDRKLIIDSSLCGMGRGAGNTTTELLTNFLNTKHNCNYDMNAVMDAIDMYMEGIKAKYEWGYSTKHFISGIYQCHVNNVAYLLKNHRTNSHDMRNIIESLSTKERREYNYELLESKYIENLSRTVDDSNVRQDLKHDLKDRKVLLLAPGKSLDLYYNRIQTYIKDENPVVVGVNAINTKYKYDYLFFVNNARYEYARDTYEKEFKSIKKILLSNIKTDAEENESIVNYNSAIKRGWEHFDNAVICCLRFLNNIDTENIVLAGFDGFKNHYNESYFDESLPSLNENGRWDELNAEITNMFQEVKESTKDRTCISFLTDSIYDLD